jgi:hypothetical protein
LQQCDTLFSSPLPWNTQQELDVGDMFFFVVIVVFIFSLLANFVGSETTRILECAPTAAFFLATAHVNETFTTTNTTRTNS